MEDGEGSTAIEQYFNQLINMRLLTQIVISDRQGNTILTCFGHADGDQGGATSDVGRKDQNSSGRNSNAHSGHMSVSMTSASPGQTEEEIWVESNVVLSAARCFQNLEQLALGTPRYISAQYHNAVVVQTVDRSCLISLVGSRAHGHCIGGLLSVLSQIRNTSVYNELAVKVQECFR